MANHGRYLLDDVDWDTSRTWTNLIAFVFVAFISLCPCVSRASSEEACKKALTAAATKDFPIQEYYRDVKIKRNDDGSLSFSKGSKAFVLWRGRTPPHIPDTAFAFHYLSNQEIVEWAIKQKKDNVRISSDTKIGVEPFHVPSNVKDEVFSLGSLPKMITRSSENRFEIAMKYLIFEKNGAHYTFMFGEDCNHDSVAQLLLASDANAKLIHGGTITLVTEVTPDKKIKSLLFELSMGCSAWLGAETSRRTNWAADSDAEKAIMEELKSRSPQELFTGTARVKKMDF